MKKTFSLFLLNCAVLAAQIMPAPTELPGDPFFIKQTWHVGGNGDSLNAMILDPVRLQLVLASRNAVVAEDVKSGVVTGKISEMHGAFGIALDNTNEFGYLSDSLYNQVNVFDQRTLGVVGRVHTAPNPTTVLFEAASGLIFVVCNVPVPGSRGYLNFTERPWKRTDVAVPPLIRATQTKPTPHAARARPAAHNGQTGPAAKEENFSVVTVIDENTWRDFADIKLSGHIAFVQTAGDGKIYVSIPDHKEIVRLDAEMLGEKLRREAPDTGIPPEHTPKEVQLRTGRPFAPGPDWPRVSVQTLDWSSSRDSDEFRDDAILFFPMDRDCSEPNAMAIDNRHARLFVACEKMKMAVLDANTGQLVTTLPTGPGTNALAYDADRGLIYAANSGGNESLTIIRQHVTDSYAVIQNLPTDHWAKALLSDPGTGLVYLATDYSDPEAEKPPPDPVHRGFQVLVIGH
jgi:hypothetical protein